MSKYINTLEDNARRLSNALKKRKAQKRKEIILLRKRFDKMLEPYMNHEAIKLQDTFIQHGKTTTRMHSENVAWICFKLNKALKLKANEEELLRVGLLHDLYLYDWHDKRVPGQRIHGFLHAERACKNAIKYFNINEKEQAAIRSHMWPLNITKVPKSKEAWLLTISDKFVSSLETLKRGGRIEL